MAIKKQVSMDGKTTSVKSILSSSMMQVTFFGCGIAVAAGFVPFTHKCYQFIQRAKAAAPDDYDFPMVQDLWVALMFAGIFLITHLLWVELSTKYIEPFCKEQVDRKQKEIRTRKMVLCCYSFVVYTIFSFWGYHIQKDAYYFPKCIGGSGDISLMFRDFPYQTHVPGVKLYMMVELGWHIEAFLKMVFIDARRPDFVEMSLHHLVTVYLVGGSYLINVWEIGATIQFIHDIADIFVALCRGCSETKYKNCQYISAAVCISAWTYTRIFVFGWVIYVTNNTELRVGSRFVQPFFIYGLTALLLLHAWWLYIMLKIVFTALKTGKTEDVSTNFQRCALERKRSLQKRVEGGLHHS